MMDNLIKFGKTRAPLMVFSIGLAMFGIILVSLSKYIEYNPLRNPDLQHDWNTVLESFSNFQFCVNGNATMDDALLQIHSQPENRKIYSVMLKVALKPTSLYSKERQVRFKSSMIAKQLGLKNIHTSDQDIDVFLTLPPIPAKRLNCQKDDDVCDEVIVNACVIFVSAVNVFPNMHVPKKCASDFTLPSSPKGSEDQLVFSLYWHRASRFLSPYLCRHVTRIIPQYQLNPSLTPTINDIDKARIQMHLLFTVAIVTLFLFKIALCGMYKGAKHYRPPPRQSISEDTEF